MKDLTDGLVLDLDMARLANKAPPSDDTATNVNSTLTTNQLGETNAARAFNGTTAYIDTGYLIYCGGYNTISMWINSSQTTRSRNGALDSSGNSIYVDFNNSYSGEIVITIQTGSGNIRSIKTDADSGWNDGNWHLVTAVFNLTVTNMKIYLDDSLLTTSTRTNTGSMSNVTLSEELFIGARSSYGSPDSYLACSFGSYYIWPKELTITEIAAIYNDGAIPQDDLVYDLNMLTLVNEASDNFEITNTGSTITADEKNRQQARECGSGDSIISDNTYNLNSPFTLGGMVNFNSLNKPLYVGGVGGSGNGRYAQITSGLVSYGVTDEISISYYDGSWKSGSSGETASTGQWYHVIGVFNPGTDMKLYVDGVLKSTVSIGTAGVSREFGINIIGGGTLVYGDSIFSSFKQWDRALSQEEVQQDYAEIKGNYQGLFDDCVAYYDMSNEGEYATATNTGTTEVQLPSHLPSVSRTFNGSSDYLDIDDALTYVSSDTTGTISAWINIADSTSQGQVISFGDTNTSLIIMLYVEAGGILTAFAREGSAVNAWGVDTNSAIPLKEWVHVALVQDGSEPVLYVNGVAPSQAFFVTTDKTTWLADAPLIDTARIGDRNYNNGGESKFFNGEIATTRIWSKALSQSEITDLYESGEVDTDSLELDINYEDLTDSSDNSVTVTNSGTATNDTGSDKFSVIRKFDGSGDYITLGTGINYPTSGWTIAMAFKAPSVDRYRRLFNVRSASTPYFFLDLDSSAGGDDLRLQINDGSNTNAINSVNSYDDGEWYYVIAKTNGTTIYMNTYSLDGTAIETLSVTSTQASDINGKNTVLGYDAFASSTDYDGDMAMCKVWNKYLDATDEASVIAGGTPEEDLVYDLNMESLVNEVPNSGTTVYDLIGQNDGTNSGATLVSDHLGIDSAAYEFNGTNTRIDVNDIDFPANDYTVSYWVNMTASNYGGIFIPYKDVIVYFSVDQPTGKFKWGVIGGATYELKSDAITLGVWYNITCVKSSTGGMQLYTNGVLSESNAYNGLATSLSRTTQIGAFKNAGGTYDNFFNGKIGSFKLFDGKTFTAEEAKLEYDLTKVKYIYPYVQNGGEQ